MFQLSLFWDALRNRDREKESTRDRETERQRDRETERQRDRETERQRDRETERKDLCGCRLRTFVRGLHNSSLVR